MHFMLGKIKELEYDIFFMNADKLLYENIKKDVCA